MSLPVLDRTTTLEAVRGAARTWSDLLRSVRDPHRIAIGHWDIGTVAAHVSHIYDLNPRLVGGDSSPAPDHRKLGDTWEELLAADAERDPAAIADRIDRATETFVAAATPDVWESPTSWHGGIKAPVYTLAAILVNEAMIHGLDVARAEGRQWDITPDQGRLVIDGLLPVLPHFVDEHVAAGLSAAFELRPRGGKRLYFSLDEGSLHTSDTPARVVDCRISADPVSYLLVGYGRISKWGAIATGKIVSWGRKPWLGLTFGKLFSSP